MSKQVTVTLNHAEYELAMEVFARLGGMAQYENTPAIDILVKLNNAYLSEVN